MVEEIISIPLHEISANPFQPRRHFDETALRELAESIRHHGVLQPILVRPWDNGYQLVAGERRFRASHLAGLREIPCRLSEFTDAQMLEVALVENVQREDINPVEAARAYQRLMQEFGYGQPEIAARTGKARTTITNTLRLLHLPAAVLDLVEDGSLSEGHARLLLSLSDPAQQHELGDYIARNGLTVRESERLVRKLLKEAVDVSRETSPTSTPKKDVLEAGLEERMSQHFGTKVALRRQGSTGSLTLEFYDEDDLQRLLELLGLDSEF